MTLSPIGRMSEKKSRRKERGDRENGPRFIWILPSSTSSLDRQMRTVSLRFLPLIKGKSGEEEEGGCHHERESPVSS